jgi:hypothetical protein
MSTTAQLTDVGTGSRSSKSEIELAKRARDELAAATVALQHAGALFAAIEKAINDGSDKDAPFLLAQIGVETTAYQAERCNSESDFFDEARHG